MIKRYYLIVKGIDPFKLYMGNLVKGYKYINDITKAEQFKTHKSAKTFIDSIEKDIIKYAERHGFVVEVRERPYVKEVTEDENGYTII